MAMDRIIQPHGHGLGEPMTLIELSQKQGATIRRDPTTFKIGREFFSEKAPKMKLFVADCIHRASSLRYSFG